MMYGQHMIIDAISRSKKLSSTEAVFRFLDELPKQIGMKKIITPYVIPYEHEVPEDSGVSGFVMIAESHISVHTYPHRGFFLMDVFSCKEFDAEKTVELIKDYFEAEDARVQLVERKLPLPQIKKKTVQE